MKSTIILVRLVIFGVVVEKKMLLCLQGCHDPTMPAAAAMYVSFIVLHLTAAALFLPPGPSVLSQFLLGLGLGTSGRPILPCQHKVCFYLVSL